MILMLILHAKYKTEYNNLINENFALFNDQI